MSLFFQLYREDRLLVEQNLTTTMYNETFLCEYLGSVEELAFDTNGTFVIYDNSPS